MLFCAKIAAKRALPLSSQLFACFCSVFCITVHMYKSFCRNINAGRVRGLLSETKTAVDVTVSPQKEHASRICWSCTSCTTGKDLSGTDFCHMVQFGWFIFPHLI